MSLIILDQTVLPSENYTFFNMALYKTRYLLLKSVLSEPKLFSPNCSNANGKAFQLQQPPNLNLLTLFYKPAVLW